jgi:hypothetical protein
MSWSYSGDPSLSSRDKVRFLIGDTDDTDEQLQDEEIDAMLADNSSEPYAAAIACAYVLAAKYSRRADRSVGDLSISYNQIGDSYRKLATQLKSQAATSSAGFKPYAGGISISDKEVDEENDDLKRPNFKLGMHDFATPQPDGPIRQDR